MTIDELNEIVDNPDLIPGIFNYCDRWCAHCKFTERCATFAIEKMQGANYPEVDINDELFWKRLGEIFQLTLEMVKRDVEKLGLDFESIDQNAFQKREDKIKYELRNEPCSTLSKDYIQLINNWFASSRELFDERAKELNRLDDIGLPKSSLEKEINDLNRSIEVVLWFQYQIHVKIMRAVRGELEDELDGFDNKNYPKDSDGSAKVALLGIDQSVTAWSIILSYFPAKEDELLDILVYLQRLERKVENKCPHARAFSRPGFDDQ